MSRYIDANALIDRMKKDPLFSLVERYGVTGVIEAEPTVDVVEKFIDELTREISDRVIQALEANYEIIPKKPVVRCKDCKHSVKHQLGYGCGMNYHLATNGNWFCADGERKEDD